MAVERAWKSLCIRYGFATKLTLKQDLDTAPLSIAPGGSSSGAFERRVAQGNEG
jgi:hypothetical protein